MARGYYKGAASAFQKHGDHRDLRRKHHRTQEDNEADVAAGPLQTCKRVCDKRAGEELGDDVFQRHIDSIPDEFPEWYIFRGFDIITDKFAIKHPEIRRLFYCQRQVNLLWILDTRMLIRVGDKQKMITLILIWNAFKLPNRVFPEICVNHERCFRGVNAAHRFQLQ